MSKPPVLHVFGHVHAKQFEEEAVEGPRLCADRQNGILFANVAAETRLPSLSSAALAGQMARKKRKVMSLTFGGEDIKFQGNGPQDQRLWLRPPVLLRVPLHGRICRRGKDDNA